MITWVKVSLTRPQASVNVHVLVYVPSVGQAPDCTKLPAVLFKVKSQEAVAGTKELALLSAAILSQAIVLSNALGAVDQFTCGGCCTSMIVGVCVPIPQEFVEDELLVVIGSPLITPLYVAVACNSKLATQAVSKK